MRHLWPVRDQVEFATRERLRIASLSDNQRLRILTDIFERCRRRKSAIEGIDIAPIDIDQLSDDQVLALWGRQPGEETILLAVIRKVWSAIRQRQVSSESS
jgi:hypothetical protein